MEEPAKTSGAHRKRGIVVLFYLTLKENHDVGFSPFQEQDKLGAGVIGYLSAPLPLSMIHNVQHRLSGKKPMIVWNRKDKSESIKRHITKIVEDLSWDTKNMTWKEVRGCSSSGENPLDLGRDKRNAFWQAINQRLLGRQLSIRDFQGLAQELTIEEDEIIKLAHYNVEQGKAQWVPSVERTKRGWQCQRCGEKDVEEWSGFYGPAATCRTCESIGTSTSLKALYRDKRSLLDGPSIVSFEPRWVLTEAQRQASEQVADFIKGTSRDRALLWAACGAGKTEVCFPAAAWALKEGKSVLFAAPRQDVILDIAPRLKRDFPNYPIQVLTGNTSVKFQVGGMVLATTHQVLRFWQSFDVVFMDEMDAFPYHGSRALEWGLHQALRQGGKLLYLTATPSRDGLKAVQQGEMLLIRLPARHHRRPLPVPIWIKSRNPPDPNGCTGVWAKQIELLRRQGPVLVFVPKISWVDPWIKCFSNEFPGWQVGGSYSADSERGVKIRNLQKGVYDIFVSTTILERGITLPGIQVVVIGSDHPMFDERSLVQMAGRVGRTKENPEGGILFLSKQMTCSMKTAVQWIKEQNRRALELGLID
ncbi:DEAD/DEAH box helicase family protein [Desulfosporosinus youngiae]|uniref:Superfamily II DNA/RNA helicase required for DNA uptake (Late competence protein) n=1 Tax=Desulfosporosinus youngiae DSM 17734 TaxID=768710 RepID=H5Y0I9_9FIRM|nr:DEAD/DEAH box helicase family protein [Desulfosporosinus youngiae]EHQ92245.1 superfamily II DNA/RNA helicase required for DNA uptake (late competence protein) [Desulfosporosinus youngiae DSM 17734]